MYDLSYLPTFIKNNNPIKYGMNRFYGKRFLQKSPRKVELYSNKTKNYEIEIYIVAFNNKDLIKSQIYFLKKNCLDNYKLVIADNSSNKEVAEKIENICKRNHIDYIKLSENNKLELSWSHGYSLNYLMKHFIMGSRVPYFGFLDHDCFMIRPISIVKKLKKYQMWGGIPQNHDIKIFNKKINGMGSRRFIRPGCCFFKKELFNKGYDFTPNKKFNPLSFLDTGGGNRKFIYKYFKGYDKTILIDRIRYGEYEILGNEFFHIEAAGHRGKNKVKKYIKYLHKNY